MGSPHCRRRPNRPQPLPPPCAAAACTGIAAPLLADARCCCPVMTAARRAACRCCLIAWSPLMPRAAVLAPPVVSAGRCRAHCGAGDCQGGGHRGAALRVAGARAEPAGQHGRRWVHCHGCLCVSRCVPVHRCWAAARDVVHAGGTDIAAISSCPCKAADALPSSHTCTAHPCFGWRSPPCAAATSKELRQSTLESLGYCCEELGNLDEDYLSQQVGGWWRAELLMRHGRKAT